MNNFDFQTPIHVCKYMVSLIPIECNTVLEPTPGAGNLVQAIKDVGFFTPIVTENFWDIINLRPDAIVMNPPFTPMAEGYKILYQTMLMTENIIALMPWLTIINSSKRTENIRKFGLKSITHLPRNIFAGARVQTCILQMIKGYCRKTELRFY